MFFEMLGEYIMDGFKVAITVAAMLIGFVALIAGINSVFDMIFGISFPRHLGVYFCPVCLYHGDTNFRNSYCRRNHGDEVSNK